MCFPVCGRRRQEVGSGGCSLYRGRGGKAEEWKGAGFGEMEVAVAFWVRGGVLFGELLGWKDWLDVGGEAGCLTEPAAV